MKKCICGTEKCNSLLSLNLIVVYIVIYLKQCVAGNLGMIKLFIPGSNVLSVINCKMSHQYPDLTISKKYRYV